MTSGIMTKILSFSVAALILAMSSGCQSLMPVEEVPMPPPLVEPGNITYTTVDVARGDMVQSVQGVGRLESIRMIDAFFKAGGGRVKSVSVKIGDGVKAGDLLLQLDTDDLDYRLEVERLRLKQMENSCDLQRAAVKRIPAPSLLQDSGNDLEITNLIIRRMELETQLANAEIDLEISRLNIRQMEKEKENATLIAPIDGSVVYVTTVNQGSWVDAYSPLVRIADQSAKMLTYIDDANRSQFQVGMKVQVTFQSGGAACVGEVVSTPFEREGLDSPDAAKALYIKVPDEFLKDSKVGDEAAIMLVLAERKNVMKLPRNVIRVYLQRRYVQVLVNNVKVEKDVKIGLETTTETEIVSGLEVGEKVIVR
jgi:RND family efflux transporter MFP subunit